MADRLDYIEFPSTERARSSAFFQAAFGWGITSYGPVYDGLEGAGIDGGVDGSADRVAATMAVIRTDDLDAAERRVVSAGGPSRGRSSIFPADGAFTFASPAATKSPSMSAANSATAAGRR